MRAYWKKFQVSWIVLVVLISKWRCVVAYSTTMSSYSEEDILNEITGHWICFGLFVATLVPLLIATYKILGNQWSQTKRTKRKLLVSLLFAILASTSYIDARSLRCWLSFLRWVDWYRNIVFWLHDKSHRLVPFYQYSDGTVGSISQDALSMGSNGFATSFFRFIR